MYQFTFCNISYLQQVIKKLHKCFKNPDETATLLTFVTNFLKKYKKLKLTQSTWDNSDEISSSCKSNFTRAYTHCCRTQMCSMRDTICLTDTVRWGRSAPISDNRNDSVLLLLLLCRSNLSLLRCLSPIFERPPIVGLEPRYTVREPRPKVPSACEWRQCKMLMISRYDRSIDTTL